MPYENCAYVRGLGAELCKTVQARDPKERYAISVLGKWNGQQVQITNAHWDAFRVGIRFGWPPCLLTRGVQFWSRTSQIDSNISHKLVQPAAV